MLEIDWRFVGTVKLVRHQYEGEAFKPSDKINKIFIFSFIFFCIFDSWD